MTPAKSGTRSIAVITAPNVAYANPGMTTVDLAFESVRNRLNVSASVHWYCLLGPSDRPIWHFMTDGSGLPFEFRPLHNSLDQVYEHDAIVFWGDFLHARHYIEQDGINHLKRLDVESDSDKSRRILHRSLLFSDAPDDTFSRVTLYGGNILHNSQSDYADERYSDAYHRLMARSRDVWLRDPISAAKASHLRPPQHAAHFGADAALLLDDNEIDSLPVTGWAAEIPDNETIGVFVGKRTPIPPWFADFCHLIADRFSLKLEWLPWPVSEPPDDLDIPSRHDDYTFGDLLAALPRYKFIISDTYHACLNAWRSGTPAICIGSPQPGPSFGGVLSLNDLKKHVFYAAYDATDLYVSTLDGMDGHREEQFERISRIIDHGADAIVTRIRQHATRSREALTSALDSLLAE